MRYLSRTLMMVAPLLLAPVLLLGCASAGIGKTHAGVSPAASGPSAGIAPVMPPPGFIYQDTIAPLSYNFHATSASPGKVGRATSMFFSVPFTYGFLSFAWGGDNASLQEAARNAGITKIDYADYELLNIIGVFKEYTVITYGE